MRLVRILSSDSEAELVAILEMLEAFEIPCFVHKPVAVGSPECADDRASRTASWCPRNVWRRR